MVTSVAIMLFIATDRRTETQTGFEMSSTGAVSASELLLAGEYSSESQIEESSWAGMVQNADLRTIEAERDPRQLHDGHFLEQEPSSFSGSPKLGPPVWTCPEKRVISI